MSQISGAVSHDDDNSDSFCTAMYVAYLRSQSASENNKRKANPKETMDSWKRRRKTHAMVTRKDLMQQQSEWSATSSTTQSSPQISPVISSFSPTSPANSLNDAALQSSEEQIGPDYERERTDCSDLQETPDTHSALQETPVTQSALQETPVIHSALLGWFSVFDGNSSETPYEIPSFPEEETEPHINASSRLTAPNPRHTNNLNLSEERKSLVTRVVSLLVCELTRTLDVDEMVHLADGSFKYLESLGVDFTPLYEKVSAFISFHCDQKSVVEDTSSNYAYVIKNQHQEVLVKLSEAEGALSQSDADVKNSLEKLLPLRTRVEEMKEKLKKAEMELRAAEEEMAQGEAEVDCLEVERDGRAEACSIVEEELRSILPLAEEAEAEIKNIEQRWERANAGVKRMSSELLLLKK